MAKRLTSESVESLKRPKAGYTLTWDSEVRGFGVRVTAAGAKSFILFYRTLGGRQRRITLGRHPALTASTAPSICGWRTLCLTALKAPEFLEIRRQGFRNPHTGARPIHARPGGADCSRCSPPDILAYLHSLD